MFFSSPESPNFIEIKRRLWPQQEAELANHHDEIRVLLCTVSMPIQWFNREFRESPIKILNTQSKGEALITWALFLFFICLKPCQASGSHLKAASSRCETNTSLCSYHMSRDDSSDRVTRLPQLPNPVVFTSPFARTSTS